MFASLGNIKFETLKGFDTLSDKYETKYTELTLINGKPTLQRTGEALIEITMGVTFHVAFCNPEDEFLNLNTARANGEILPFIFGNGFYLGDFVITAIDRTINDADKNLNFVSITCNVTLKEYASGNTAAKQLEQDKRNAFAVSSNRPLPANTTTATDNPALSVCNNVKTADLESAKMSASTDEIKAATDAVTSGATDQAQKFLDQRDKYISDCNSSIADATAALGSANSLISAVPSISTLAPTLSAQITATTTALTAVTTQLATLNGLPNPATSGNAASILTQLTNTVNVIKTLRDNMKLLKEANTPVAAALASKKVLT